MRPLLWPARESLPHSGAAQYLVLLTPLLELPLLGRPLLWGLA